MKSLLKLKPYLRPYVGLIALSLVLAIPMGAIRASPIVMAQKLIKDVLIAKDPSKLLYLTLFVIGIFVLNFFVRFGHSYSIRVVVARVNQRIKNELYDHMMGLSADYFSDRSTGGLISRAGEDPNKIDQGISQIPVAIREPITLALCLGYTFYVNWKLTLLTIAIFPPMAAVFALSGKALKRYIHRLAQNQEKIYSSLQESFSGIRIIKSFRLEGYMRAKYRERSEAFTRTLLKSALVEEVSHPLVELFTAFAIAGLIYYGGAQVVAGDMTSEQLMGFFTAFGMMMNPIRSLNDMNIKLTSAAGACERVFEIFGWKSRLKEVPNPKAVSGFDHAIEFRDVRFAYPDAPDREILRGVTFKVDKGRSVALVGASGAGKSSLVSLLPRIFDVTGGAILIDGVDLHEVKLPDLRGLISVVSQDVFLFNDTIAENIRCGRLDATDEEIRWAAKEAFVLDFIDKLPHGFETVIGDRGQKLSGGERQRLSIARAFLRHSPILILDEATSSLDSASEKAVQAALEKLMRDRTTLLIAHRLSTIRHADQILVMRQGEIVERGRHDELLEQNGEYAQYLKLSESAERASVQTG